MATEVEYIVNGAVLRASVPLTAYQLKEQFHSPQDRWVMANKRNGEVQQVSDEEFLPGDAEDFSIIPRFRYGTHA